MIFSLAWARANPASKSRYFWMRLPSDHTCRMASVPKMFLKIAESIVPVGMARPFCFAAFLATKPIAVILRCALLRASKDAAQAVALRGSTLTRRAPQGDGEMVVAVT